jgi:hypothetical protein
MKATVEGLGVHAKHIHEVVYGYQDRKRVRCEGNAMVGVLEAKSKIWEVDIALPAAPYDLRITLALETAMDEQVREAHRTHRRRC